MWSQIHFISVVKLSLRTDPHTLPNSTKGNEMWILGQAKIFGATCLTQDSHQNGQEQLW